MNERAGIVIGALVAAAALWWYLRPRGIVTVEEVPQTDIVFNFPDLPEIGALVDTVKDVFVPRGIRNHNPGNIRWDGVTAWQGQIGRDDAGFVKFDNPVNGIRAMARVLKNYAKRGLDTVTEIISAWAPPSENNTAAYIAAVAGAMRIDPNSRFGAERWPDLLAAIINHENGQQPYALATIQAGIAAA